MTKIDHLTPQKRHDYLYFAVIEHYRSWLMFDGVELTRINQAGGILDAASVRRIAREYLVIRGIKRIPQGQQIDIHANGVALHLNSLHPVANLTLAQRCQLCINAAIWANDNDPATSRPHTNGVQLSAMSKLSWFLDNTNWTLYDRFASSALGLAQTGINNTARMTQFYGILQRRDFLGCSNQIQAYLTPPFAQELRGERIIDKFLMISGAPSAAWRRNLIEICEHFRDNLPCPKPNALHDLAVVIAHDFENHPFFTAPL